MIEVYAKIGTMSGCWIVVNRKTMPPVAGDHIEFKEIPTLRGEKWETGIVDEVYKNHHGDNIYFVARM